MSMRYEVMIFDYANMSFCKCQAHLTSNSLQGIYDKLRNMLRIIYNAMKSLGAEELHAFWIAEIFV